MSKLWRRRDSKSNKAEISFIKEEYQVQMRVIYDELIIERPRGTTHHEKKRDELVELLTNK